MTDDAPLLLLLLLLPLLLLLLRAASAAVMFVMWRVRDASGGARHVCGMNSTTAMSQTRQGTRHRSCFPFAAVPTQHSARLH